MAETSKITGNDDDAPQPAPTTVSVLQEAAPARPERKAPAAKRSVQAEGGNVIAFTFAPGQSMPEHQAAHPITVQCLSGHLDFTVGEEVISLDPGVVVHLPARVPHGVECPAQT